MWVALIDIPPAMGSLKFASRTHERQAFGERGIDVERTEGWYNEYLAEAGNPVVVHGPIRAGDVTVRRHSQSHATIPQPQSQPQCPVSSEPNARSMLLECHDIV